MGDDDGHREGRGGEMNTIELWKKDAEVFGGNLAMFWAGRVSIAAGIVVRSSAVQLSSAIELLDACLEIYDAIVFDEARTRK